MNRVLWVALAVGCSGSTTPDDGPPLTETGWFEDTGQTNQNCPDRFVATVPEDGTQGWYWRDRPQVFSSTSNPSAYSAWIEGPGGERIETELRWDEGAGQSATLEWDGYLEPSTDYTLAVKDCFSVQEVGFRTSELGTPLSVAPQQLEGNTYLLDLAGATWVEPAALAGIIQVYFTTPVLLGVTYADPERIDLLGAPGLLDQLGNVRQDPNAPTWDFPLASFDQSPFLDVQAESIVLSYSDYGADVDIPVEDFVFQATFQPDGAALRGGVLVGLGDTRGIGALLGDDRPEALCELAEGLGVTCLPCTDGGPYCLNVRAERVDGELVPNLSLSEQQG